MSSIFRGTASVFNKHFTVKVVPEAPVLMLSANDSFELGSEETKPKLQQEETNVRNWNEKLQFFSPND